MARAAFHSTTLDELLGPDSLAELRAARLDIGRITEAKRNGIAPDMPELRAAATRAVAAAEGLAERTRRPARSFFLVTTFEVVSRIDWEALSFAPVEGDGPSFHVELFPSLRGWMTSVRWMLGDRIRQEAEGLRRALADLRETVVRFAAFEMEAARRHLASIQEALASLRLRSPVPALPASGVPTVRDMIALLLSPHVLASGGVGLFTPLN